jgi:adenylate kinase
MEHEQKKVLIFLGPPGSGKGTQAKRLSQRLDLPHISTGDLLRENIRAETDLGEKARDFIDKGHLVPDDLVINMLFERISRPDCDKGYILDGYPRRVSQADVLQERLSDKDQVVALNLLVPDDVIVERLAGRLTCRNCGYVYHKVYNPPADPDRCDKCGGEIYQRPDDDEKVIRKRLSTYKEETSPLIKYYSEKDLLVEIDGNKAPDTVFSAILELF